MGKTDTNLMLYVTLIDAEGSGLKTVRAFESLNACRDYAHSLGNQQVMQFLLEDVASGAQFIPRGDGEWEIHGVIPRSQYRQAMVHHPT